MIPPICLFGSGTDQSGGTGTSQTVLPQPPLPTNEVARWDFTAHILEIVDIQPDPNAPSPYDDIASTDPNWGVVNAAIERHLLQPDSSTHSGAYEAITLGMVDQMYWNALGISQPQYQPGMAPYIWGNDIGLNPPGESQNTLITPQDEQTILTNLGNLQKGYYEVNGVYHVRYPAVDEYAATFAGDVNPSTGQQYFPTTDAIQRAITNTYQFYDNTTFRLDGSNLIVTIPSTVNSNWFAYSSTADGLEYSTDGGTTWVSTGTFDEQNLAGTTVQNNSILLRVSDGTSIIISFNQLFPDYGGTVNLGQLSISDADNSIQVVRLNVNQ